MRPRLYPDSEYEQTIGEPLSPRKLAAIWRTLDEQDRFPFVLSLEETIADKVIELCAAPAHQPAEGKRT